ncbi:fungal-specific transcription factor domain-containing protein [Dendryphion nanum]|uniref:Fungal-specific transcription factor domain-containing protein n=1 Tax=Dendryphion nanum TaxID=256645 RepID=A0A9P9DKX1_9PLEO|nr:fungal-specific transcription factor domain-containing protein [Dendryphion nanum]
MEGTNATRKSCDLCYRRKMKCDGQKPRCSHCITYEIDCTYTAPSRTSAPKKRRSYAKGEDSISNTQGRLGRLECLVQQVTERLDIVEGKDEVEPSVQHEEASAITTVMPLQITRSEDDNNSPKSMVLPPLEQVMPIVQIYLQDFNSVLPLFHADTLLGLVHDCYSVGPLKRDPVVWAAINVVLALARRHNFVATHDIPSSSACLRRAESVLSRVVLGDTQLLNIQVLVGMVMLLQASPDIKPALVLIATTIRLAHSIGLHDRTYSAHLDSVHARQRACVFWMAYILDKDISMRSKQPSIQVDDDINLDLPSPTVVQCNEDRSKISNTDDAAGVITTADGTVKMNYLTARVQLAAVEGGVYDYIYSTRSRKRSPEERSHALQSVAYALEQWKASIPSEFNALAGSRRVAHSTLHFLGTLHSTSLACTTLINQAHAWDVEWIASVRRYGRQGIEPLLPPKWEVLVGEARDLLVLFGILGEPERWNFWISGCSYMTAMVLLTANSMHRPKHGDLSLDNHLVEIGLRTINTMAKDTENEILQSFQATCTELHQRTQQRCAEAAIMASNADGTS